jgi:hypothetical protein
MKEKKKSNILARGDRKYTKERLITVAAFASALEAQFIKGVMEAEGIESVIANADTMMLSGGNSSTVTPVSLLVKESDANASQEILNSIEKNISEEYMSPEIDPDWAFISFSTFSR